MQNTTPNRLTLILILGSLTALSPFSIDMYLSAFPLMAKFFDTNVAAISVTLSSYFVGLASGQLFYGPLMDCYGRKVPLLVGLLIFVLASLGCAFATTLDALVVLRFIQAAGGCAASVAAFAMVRDLFEPRESAKILSLLILILGVSPLLAPTIGGYLAIYFGWASVFYTLSAGSLLLLFVVMKFLPESHAGDPSQVLRPLPILKNYFEILKEPKFWTYAVSGAMGFSGLFVYLAASPVMFMEIFGVSEQVYGWIFAFIAMGLVGMSQLNVVLMKQYTNEKILFGSLAMLTFTSAVFAVTSFFGFFNLFSVVGTMFIFLSCVGLANPNSAALAMESFGHKAGSAAALIGFLQMGFGALASVCVGILKTEELFPLACIFVGTSALSLLILSIGSKRLTSKT